MLSAVKVFAISAAVVFAALGVKASVPFATTHLPSIWNFCLLCFKPPFLYLLVNAIIISILASSKYFHHHHSLETTTPPPSIPQPPLIHVVNDSASPTLELEEEKAIDVGVVVNSVEESTWTPLHSVDSAETPPDYLLAAEKPLVSARFGHRKPPKSTPEGGKASLRVVGKPKRQETLESTWKAITEGRRSMPLSRHVKKCDTWQYRGSAGPHELVNKKNMKSETFKDRTNQHQLATVPIGARLRKEPSLSQDELNRRVEAFIREFNEQMRLQRQESLNQYMQMINRGADD